MLLITSSFYWNIAKVMQICFSFPSENLTFWILLIQIFNFLEVIHILFSYCRFKVWFHHNNYLKYLALLIFISWWQSKHRLNFQFNFIRHLYLSMIIWGSKTHLLRMFVDVSACTFSPTLTNQLSNLVIMPEQLDNQLSFH